jgi:uroporphyrinogen decarboxylase
MSGKKNATPEAARMKSRERFYAAMEYRGYDRTPTKHYGTPEINQQLLDTFGVSSVDELRRVLGDDFCHVAPRYVGPELRSFPDGTWEGIWGERYTHYSFGKGTYPEAVHLPFREVRSPEELKDYRFPSVAWYDFSNIAADCEAYQDYAVCAGGAGVPDFLNGIARTRGVEQVLFDIAVMDPVYLELVERRFDFFYSLYERVLQAGKGKIDVLCLGEDYGTQNGLVISPRAFERLFAPKMKAFFDLAHRYGARSMMHCCGSCRALIPRLIELGLDILEVVQVDAVGMDIRELHEQFYGKLAFCGSISVQKTLPFGSVEEVTAEVELRKRLFRQGGMIIAATHDIQVGTPIENILAMYRAIGSLQVRDG